MTATMKQFALLASVLALLTAWYSPWEGIRIFLLILVIFILRAMLQKDEKDDGIDDASNDSVEDPNQLQIEFPVTKRDSKSR